jgi:uncharacterized protein
MIITNTWKDFWNFIKQPTPLGCEHTSFKTKLSTFFVLIFSNALIQMFLAYQISQFSQNLMGPDNTHKLLEFAVEASPLMLFLTAAITAPLLEEVAFRLSLVFRPIYFGLSFLAISPFLLKDITITTTIPYFNWLMALVVSLIIVVVFSIPSIKNRTALFWERKLRWIVYFFVLLFGLVHILNFGQMSLKIILFSPIITLPQIISGFVLSYLRLRFGFQWALW